MPSSRQFMEYLHMKTGEKVEVMPSDMSLTAFVCFPKMEMVLNCPRAWAHRKVTLSVIFGGTPG